MVIALAGNPNCGKTTLFNALTGSSQYVGNWPGVTVEKKEGLLKLGHRDEKVTVTDLPGIYSLSPYTLEEVVARRYLLGERPDVIIDVVDAANIERNLYLTTQLIETGIPVVAALNMMDVTEKRGDEIDMAGLEKTLGCPVVPVSALRERNLDRLVDTALRTAREDNVPTFVHLKGNVESAVQELMQMLHGRVPEYTERWYAVRLLERDEDATAGLHLSGEDMQRAQGIISALENECDDDTESIIINERYEQIRSVVSKNVNRREQGMTGSDRIDRIVTNRVLAIPIFAAVMCVVYWVAVSWIGTVVTDWSNDVLFGTYITDWVLSGMTAAGSPEWLVSLVVDGIIGGVGAVLGFVPQMMILFFLLSMLEDCGYMARVAFIMDRVFRKFGLSGRSFIPYMVASGCGVPGIMATRTIENENDRRMTILTTTFIPCGAKLPIIALIAGAIFGPDAWWVAPLAYFIGIGAVIMSGVILKKTKPFMGEPAPFVMELPPYRLPGIKGVLIHMWERTRGFIVKAGTIIFVSTVVIWLLSNFSWMMQMTDMNDSILAGICGVLAPLFAPLGFGSWQAAAATFTGLIAKENVVATMGVVYGLGEVEATSGALMSSFAAAFTPAAALSFLIFNLLCAPCFAAIGAMRRELNSAAWTWAAVGYQTGLAYVMSFIVYQIAEGLFAGGGFNVLTAAAFVLIAMLIWLMCRNAKPGPVTSVRAVEVNR